LIEYSRNKNLAAVNAEENNMTTS